MQQLAQPVKLWYLSTCFRYERAQAGRYRQFWQIGAEAIGSDDPAVDVRAGGPLGVSVEIEDRVARDLVISESIALPRHAPYAPTSNSTEPSPSLYT